MKDDSFATSGGWFLKRIKEELNIMKFVCFYGS
jgi:hypothetical protein